jgi:DNA-binding PadR family transcriptional regulator
MFWHVVLGLLRDGRPRHGYELRTMYRERSGTELGSGNFYRELTRLAGEGFVQAVANPPDADTRRIPYEIKDRGRHVFDEWLLAAPREHDDLYDWLLFADRVPATVRDRILDRRLEDLWLRNKMLARAREDAGISKIGQFAPRLASITRQMKQVSAEIEFLEEFRKETTTWEGLSVRETAEPVASKEEAIARNPTRVKRKGEVER